MFDNYHSLYIYNIVLLEAQVSFVIWLFVIFYVHNSLNIIISVCMYMWIQDCNVCAHVCVMRACTCVCVRMYIHFMWYPCNTYLGNRFDSLSTQ